MAHVLSHATDEMYPQNNTHPVTRVSVDHIHLLYVYYIDLMCAPHLKTYTTRTRLGRSSTKAAPAAATHVTDRKFRLLLSRPQNTHLARGVK